MLTRKNLRQRLVDPHWISQFLFVFFFFLLLWARYKFLTVTWGCGLETDTVHQGSPSNNTFYCSEPSYTVGSKLLGPDNWEIWVLHCPAPWPVTCLLSGLSMIGWGLCLGLNQTYFCLIWELVLLLGWLSLGVRYGHIYLVASCQLQPWQLTNLIRRKLF